MCHKYLILLFFILYSFFVYADEKNKYQDVKVKFSKTTLTVKQGLDELNALPEVNIIYKGQEAFLDYEIVLPTDPVSVVKALNLIEKQAPVDIVFSNNYVIIKSRKLKKSYELKGNLKDAETQEALIGATVLIPGTTQGTVTNVNGEFVLNLTPGNYHFEISYLGYHDKYIDVKLYEDKSLQIFLETEQRKIEEVKVIGNYYEIQDLEKGRNIERIDAKTIKQIIYNNPADALQGRVNGVWATRVSGAPGDHQKVRIRGINSLFAATDPLYVINGVQVPIVNLNSLGIADINIHDIESITVLKDVASTAYYGYQGGNGVVKIETKKGGKKKQINFSSRTGLQFMKKRYPLMNSSEFLYNMTKMDSAYPIPPMPRFPRYYTYIDGDGISIDRYVYPLYNDTTSYINTDWQDELFQNGIVQDYQLAFQGSKKKINYYISGNYYDHNGIVVNSNYKKYSYSVNLSSSPVKNLLIDLSCFGSVQKNKNNLDNYLGNRVILQGINIEPNYDSLSGFEKLRYRDYRRKPTHDPVYNMNRPGEMYAFRSADMPDLYINNWPDGHTFFSLRNQALNIISNNFSPGLKYFVNKNISVTNRSSLTFKDYNYESNIKFDSTFVKYYNSNEKYRVINNVFGFHYSKVLLNHAVNLSATHRFYRDQVKWDVDSVDGFNLDEIDKSTDGYIRGSNAVYGELGNITRNINSLILHTRYSYKNKYSVSVFVNFDHLAEGNYVDVKTVFPSVAVNWDISKEHWLSSIEALNELSVFVNWGMVGNYPLNSLSNDLLTETRLSNIENHEDAIYISNLANHELKHEEVEEINVGLKANLFQNRLSLITNFYRKENRNLIIHRDIPYYYGGGYYMKNLGDMLHTGFELSVEAYPIETSKFNWNTLLGYSTDKQHVTNLYKDHDTLLFYSTDILTPEFYIGKNAKIGDIVGYKYEGVWTEQDEELQDSNYVNHLGIKYYKKDTNSLTLTEDDKVVIGNSIPDFTFHWINNFSYKKLSVNMHWYAVIGVDKFNSTKASTYYTLRNEGIMPFVNDTMMNIKYPEFYESSYFIEDASFLRLKSLSFAYTPEKSFFRNVKASFSLSFENLLTISPYKGYDPEATVYTDNNFSNNAIDLGAYPAPKSIFLGIDLTF